MLQFQPDGRVQHVGTSSASAVKRCVGMLTVIISGMPSTSFRIPTEWIPENATVFNIATGRSNFDEGTLLGDNVSHRGMIHFSLTTFAVPCLLLVG